jgi:hypothetical protein
VKQADGSLRLSATPPPGARLLDLQLKSNTPARLDAVAGVQVDAGLVPGKWFKVYWTSAGQGVDLVLRPTGPGRLDVRYKTTLERWPAGVRPLPPRPADLMPFDVSDSTFVTGSRAYAW